MKGIVPVPLGGNVEAMDVQVGGPRQVVDKPDHQDVYRPVYEVSGRGCPPL